MSDPIKNTESPEVDGELEILKRSARYWTYGLMAFVGLALLFYMTRFLLAGSGLSSDPAAWGQFGDYFGGLLNPVIAFSAFLWLARGVQIQRQEMRDAYRALQASADAQNAMLRIQQQQIERMDVQNKNLEIAAIVRERANIIDSIQIQVSVLSQRIDVAMATYNSVLAHGDTESIHWRGARFPSEDKGVEQLKEMLAYEINQCRNLQEQLREELVWASNNNRIFEVNKQRYFGAE